MKITRGNLLDVSSGIIAHQVNCQGVMGCGVAGAIRQRYPHVMRIYDSGLSLGDCKFTAATPSLFVANLAGQLNYGRNKQHTNYAALESALTKLSAVSHSLDLPVYLPYGLGCGNAGGDWTIVSELIERILPSAILVRL